MARNGSGTYNLPSGNPVVTNTTISSSWANNTLSDIAGAITQSIAKDGQTVATANLSMGGFKHTNVASAAQANEYATLGQLQSSVSAYLVGVSGGDTITANGSPPVTSYQSGSNYRFKAVATNTTTNVTINIDSVGVIPLKRNDGLPVGIGGIASGEIIEFTYDGTNGIITSTSNSLADGGTGGSSRASGLQNLLPPQSGNSGNVLATETVQYTSVSRARSTNIATVVITPTARMPSIGDQVLISGLPASYIGVSVVISVGVNSISYYSLGSDEATTADVTGTITNYITSFLPPRTNGSIDGFIMSTAGPSSTMSISAGTASDSGNTVAIPLPSSISKTTSAWSVGSGNGGLDTGTIANNTWYHFYAILRQDTGLVDVTFSLNATTPTLPSNYTKYRRIGSAMTNSSAQWRLFTQNGDDFLWDTPVADIDANNPGTAAVTRTLTVPLGVVTTARVGVGVYGGTNTSNSVYLSSLDTSDQAAQNQVSNTLTGFATWSGRNDGLWGWANASIKTNTSSQIRSRIAFSGASDKLGISTLGWVDRRGKE